MTRCHLLYELISKKGFEGVCGLPKSQVTLIKKYMPFIEGLSKTTGIPEDTLYDNIPASSVKTVLTFEKGSDIRTKAESHIINTLKSKRSPTYKTIENAMGIESKTKVLPEQKNPKERHVPNIAIPGSNGVTQKNDVFLSILTSGQKLQWLKFAQNHNLDNEYAALCMITAKLGEM